MEAMGDLTKEYFKFDLQRFAEEGDPPGDGDPPGGGGKKEVEFYPWLDQSPDEYKKHDAFKGMKSMGELQEKYLEREYQKKVISQVHIIVMRSSIYRVTAGFQLTHLMLQN